VIYCFASGSPNTKDKSIGHKHGSLFVLRCSHKLASTANLDKQANIWSLYDVNEDTIGILKKALLIISVKISSVDSAKLLVARAVFQFETSRWLFTHLGISTPPARKLSWSLPRVKCSRNYACVCDQDKSARQSLCPFSLQQSHTKIKRSSNTMVKRHMKTVTFSLVLLDLSKSSSLQD